MDRYIEPLKRAVPYIRLYKGKTFVVKAGGEILRKPETLTNLAEDVGVLAQLGIRVVVVHGGGPQANELSRRLGHEPVVVGGRRVTGDEDLEVAKMVFAGKLNLDMISALGAQEVPAVGLAGPDANFLRARRRPRSAVPGSEGPIDWGHVGDLERVEPGIIELLLTGGYVPVICSLCSDGEGGVLNVNADSVASAVAVALRAEKLLVLTNTAGLLDDPADARSTLSWATPEEIAERKATGKISGGMLPKVDACLAALAGGVARTHILNGLREHALLSEVFTNEGCGTMILGREQSQIYEEEEMPEDEASSAGEPPAGRPE